MVDYDPLGFVVPADATVGGRQTAWSFFLGLNIQARSFNCCLANLPCALGIVWCSAESKLRFSSVYCQRNQPVASCGLSFLSAGVQRENQIKWRMVQSPYFERRAKIVVWCPLDAHFALHRWINAQCWGGAGRRVLQSKTNIRRSVIRWWKNKRWIGAGNNKDGNMKTKIESSKKTKIILLSKRATQQELLSKNLLNSTRQRAAEIGTLPPFNVRPKRRAEINGN